MMGPAVLITLGGLFLAQEFTHFGFQWPILLVVIGIVKLLQYTAPAEGHRPAQVYVPAPVVAPPPAGTVPPEQQNSQNQGVNNV